MYGAGGFATIQGLCWALPPPHSPCTGSREGSGDVGPVPSQLNAVVVVGVAVAVGLQGQQQ